MSSREEWLAALERVRQNINGIPGVTFTAEELDGVTEAALGCPCPPEPAPPLWRSGHLAVAHNPGLRSPAGVWVGVDRNPGEKLTPDKADAMAKALVDHARYAREQEAPIAHGTDRILGPVCGRVLVGQGSDTADPLCQRPKGHPGVCCHDGWTHGDHARKQATA